MLTFDVFSSVKSRARQGCWVWLFSFSSGPRLADALTWLHSAYGEFEVTDDCSDITCASFLNNVGKKTPCLLRVSTVGPERGSADAARDVHGWAMKLYTDEGNLDWVFNNTVSTDSCRFSVQQLIHCDSPCFLFGILSSSPQ